MKLSIFDDINLDDLIEEATKKVLGNILESDRSEDDEKLRQKQTGNAMRNFKATSKGKKEKKPLDVDEAPEEENSSGLKEPVQAKKTELPEITLSRIINKLNS